MNKSVIEELIVKMWSILRKAWLNAIAIVFQIDLHYNHEYHHWIYN